MIKNLLFAAMALALTVTPCTAKDVAGIDTPDTITVGQDTLILNGAALREKYAIGVDVYIGGLYLLNKSSDAMKIINADETMAIKLHLLRSVDSKDFSDSTLAGFKESCSTIGIDQKSIAKEIDLFLTVFTEGIAKNDIFDITYSKDNGIQVFKNKSKTPKVTIKNYTVKKALFGVWLTIRSEDKLNVLRKGMLGL